MLSVVNSVVSGISTNQSNIKDKYILNDGESDINPGEAIIACKGKNSIISGIISQGLKINGQSVWKDVFGSGIGALSGSVIKMVNNVTTMFTGTSIQQPWMSRKNWESTKPLTLDFQICFVAEENAKEEVYNPSMALYSFLLPRIGGGSVLIKDKDGKIQTNATFNAKDNAGQTKTYETDANGYMKANNFADLFNVARIKKAVRKNKLDDVKLIDESDGGIIGNFMSATTMFKIPGPSLSDSSLGFTVGSNNSKTSEDTQGDSVTLQIGKAFYFGAVYLESVNLTYSSSYDAEGYPLACKADIKATCMDSNFITMNEKGEPDLFNLTVDNIVKQANAIGDISKTLDACVELVTDFTEDMTKIGQKWLAFFKG